MEPVSPLMIATSHHTRLICLIDLIGYILERSDDCYWGLPVLPLRESSLGIDRYGVRLIVEPGLPFFSINERVRLTMKCLEDSCLVDLISRRFHGNSFLLVRPRFVRLCQATRAVPKTTTGCRKVDRAGLVQRKRLRVYFIH
jgi:hypothetical protein